MAAFIESPVTRLARPITDPIAVKVHVFLCRIRETAIQGYCDTFLNLEPGVRQGYVFQAAKGFGGYIALEQRAMPQSAAPSPPEFVDPRHLAGAPNVNKFTVSIPIWRYVCGANNILTDPQLCWIQPILVFNNTTLVFEDRETTGFDAFHGAIGIGPNVGGAAVPALPGEAPGLSADPDSLAADVLLSTIVDFSPISPKELLNFMTIRTGPAGPDMPDVLDDEQNLEATRQDLEKMLPYLRSMLDSGAYRMEVITLKQFRGFPDIESAVYQSLSERTYEYRDVRNMRYYDPKDVEIAFWPTDMTSQIIHDYLDLPERSVRYGSHAPDRIERELGEQFSTPDAAPLETDRSPTPFAFCFEAILEPGAMRTLHTYV